MLTYRRLLAADLVIVACLAFASSVVNPLFEPPNELQHYQYVQFLVDEGRLPVQEPNGEISQSHQPPLYYLIGATLVSGLDDPGEVPERNPYWAYDRAEEVSRDNKGHYLDPPSQAFPYRGTALVWLGWRERNWRRAASRAGVILGVFLLMDGWWFIGNLQWHGEPLALETVLDVWGRREQIVPAQWTSDLAYAWTTLWGRFGCGQVPLPRAVYLLFLFLVLASIGGGLRRLASLKRDSSFWQARPNWIIFGATVLAFGASLLYYILRNPTGANGRYVFPALPAAGGLLVAGLGGWFGSRPLSHRLPHMLSLGLFGLAVAVHLFFLPWTYSRQRWWIGLQPWQAWAQVTT